MFEAPLLAAAGLIIIGLFAVLFKTNLIKIAIGVTLIESGVNLFLITTGYRKGAVAPIYTLAPEGQQMVLPTPQALTLTAIVIGFATTALLLSLAVALYKHHGTLDARKIRRLRG